MNSLYEITKQELKGFRLYALKESWIIRKANEPQGIYSQRNYPTMPNRAARIVALNVFMYM